MRGVAALAQEGWPALQQTSVGRAMRVMAIAAILINRLVVMHKGTTLLHVAGVAGVHYAVALHQARANRSVWIVAIGAGHLAFGHRVMRSLIEQITLLFVASKADFTLGLLVAHRILCRVHLMASSAGHIPSLVGAAIPVVSLGIPRVAILAGTVAGVGRSSRLGTKGHIWMRAFARAFVDQVVFAGTVTTRARRRTGISLCAMACLANSQ